MRLPRCPFGALLALYLTFPFSAAAATTVYFAGGEDLDFTTIGSFAYDQTSGHFRSGWARGDLKISAFSFLRNVAAIPAANGGSGLTTFWLSARFYSDGGGTSSTAGFVRFTDNNGNIIQIIDTGGTGNLIRILAGGGAVLATGSCGIASVGLHKLDVYENYGTSGQVTVYLDDTLCAGFTGNNTYGGYTAISGFDLGDGVGGGGTTGWSEVLVASTDTRSMGIVTLYPAGNGNDQTWTCTGATSYGSVNVWNNSADSTLCSSASSTQIEGFTVPGLPTGTYSVVALVTSTRAIYNGTGPTHLQHMVRTGSVPADYVSPTTPYIALTTSLQDYQVVWPTNPSNSSPWLTSDITAGSFNIGVESQP